eukprot:3015992-Pleurochrysis_carterae.AAC.3
MCACVCVCVCVSHGRAHVSGVLCCESDPTSRVQGRGHFWQSQGIDAGAELQKHHATTTAAQVGPSQGWGCSWSRAREESRMRRLCPKGVHDCRQADQHQHADKHAVRRQPGRLGSVGLGSYLHFNRDGVPRPPASCRAEEEIGS